LIVTGPSRWRAGISVCHPCRSETVAEEITISGKQERVKAQGRGGNGRRHASAPDMPAPSTHLVPINCRCRHYRCCSRAPGLCSRASTQAPGRG
jgi:hypothetical protein